MSLAQGEQKGVTFTLGPQELSLINRDMKRIVEPGKLTVMVATDSEKLRNAVLEVG